MTLPDARAAALDLRILADDLTGALDSAAAFAGEVPVYFDSPPAGLSVTAAGVDRWPVQAVATATRDIAPPELPAALAPALAWLGAAGVAFKKVDSLLRGNTFAEVKLAAQAGGFERIVMAPAFPRQGRQVRDGRLFVAGAVVAGVPRLQDALADAGVPVDVPDVASDDDLRALARAAGEPAARRWLWCGSAGLAQALALRLGRAAEPGATSSAAGAPAGRLLLVSASHHAVSREQWQRLLVLRPAAEVVRHGDPIALQAVIRRLALAGQGGQGAQSRAADPVLLDLAPLARLDVEAAAALLAAQLDAVAAHLPRPGVLAVVGGDTLRGLCRATGARGLMALGSARAGWGRAAWLGGAWDGLHCHSRSGAFGTPDDLLDMVRVLGAG